ncbi:MAG: DNA translocase FtsK 4TM domain-containing protein, partial [Rubrimonas sp.]
MSDWTQGAPRAPLMPPAVALFLRRRGAEAIGLAMAAGGLGLTLALGSYDPRDPSWFVATSDAPRNWLGAGGALIADPLIRSLGLAAWGLGALLLVWGARLVLHRGAGRVWSRMTLGLLLLPLGAVFASAHAPAPSWPFEMTGLGGLLGDMALGALLRHLPVDPVSALPFATLGLALLVAVGGAVALGIDRAEARALWGFLWHGLAAALHLLWRVTVATVAALTARLRTPRSTRVAAPDPVGRARREPVLRRAEVEDADAEPVRP